MIISDGILTPAISVISAVQGIQYNTNISNAAVTGITCAILVVLFFLQPFGTRRISFLFSPIIALWFISLASIGLYNLITFNPTVLKAFSPHYIYYYWSGDSSQAWRNLGNIMLSITGAEALYADLGHFTAKSIRLSFLTLVYPALSLNYLGQTAYLMEHPDQSPVAFWASTPSSVYVPMVVIATLAAIIASQAMITGAFSITRQGIAMRCYPRFTVKHTSKHHEGQIYIPEMNFFLLVFCIIIVASFQSATRIGNAYGLAIITVMMIDTLLLSLVMLLSWDWHPAVVTAFYLVYTFISGAYLSSNLEKVVHGAWFSLVLSGILSTICYVYWWGQSSKVAYIKRHSIALHDIFEDNSSSSSSRSPPQDERTLLLKVNGDDRTSHRPVARLPGLGLYYTELLEAIPPALHRYFSLSPAIHEVVVFVTVRHVPLPSVPPMQRLLVRKLRVDGFYHVIARYGYMEDVNQGKEFVAMVVDELREYLVPGRMDAVDEVVDAVPLHFDDDLNSKSAMDCEAQQHRHAGSGTHEILESPHYTVSVSTAAGRKLLAEIKQKLQGSKPEGRQETFAEQLSGRLMMISTASTTTNPVASPSSSPSFSTLPRERPWVRQPSTFSRLSASSSLPLSARKGLQLEQEKKMIDCTTSVPLPPPPPRPSILSSTASRPKIPINATASSGSPADTVSSTTTIASNRSGPSTWTLGPNVGAGAPPKTAKPPSEEKDGMSEESRLMLTAYNQGVVYLVGRADLAAAEDDNRELDKGNTKNRTFAKASILIKKWTKKFIINGVYGTLVKNTRPATEDYQLPRNSLVELAVKYEI